MYKFNGKLYHEEEDAQRACYDAHPELFDDDMPDFFNDNIEDSEEDEDGNCYHGDIEFYSELYRMASLYEPAEYIEWGICKHCGEKIDGDDFPEYANIID